LLVTQFFGAFNDNVFKFMIGLLLAAAAVANLPTDPTTTQNVIDAVSQEQFTLAFVVMTIPLMLFSIPAGVWADRWSKRKLIVATKTLELVIMLAAMASLMVAPDRLYIPLALLGATGLQSALFSPAKYGILPELLPHERLSRGNGQIELWTFVAIVSGSAVGGVLIGLTGEETLVADDVKMYLSGQKTWLAVGFLASLSVVGLFASLRVPRTAPARPDARLSNTLVAALSTIRADRILRLAVMGSVVYWAIASLFSQNLLVYTKSLTESPTLATLPLGIMGLGVGVGSVLAGRLSKNKVEYGIIPMGAMGLTLFSLILGVFGPGYVVTCVLMVLMGLCCGLIIVPLHTILQWRTPEDRRGAVIATANAFVFGGVLAGSLIAYALTLYEVSTRGVMIAAAVGLLGASAWAIWLVPDSLLRLAFVLMTHTVYRLKIVNPEAIPESGGALLTPNHVSLIDGFLIMASTDRSVRFIVNEDYYNKWWARPMFKTAGAIPINSSGGSRQMMRALKDAGEYLAQGDVVCIFPEGGITRTGMTMPFRRGITRIAKGRGVPIIPVHLDRVWGSIFSFERGRFVRKWPQRIPYPITVSFGEHLPEDATPFEVRQAVMELGSAAWEERMADRRPLHHTFIQTVRSRPWRRAFADQNRAVSRLGALAGAIVMARKLRERWAGQDFVGLLLPPSVPAVMANVAAALAGKTSVNLNYTTGPAGLESAAKQAGLKTVVTSKAFIEKAQLELPGGPEIIYLEDVAPTISATDRAGAALRGLLAPIGSIERFCGAERAVTLADAATVIFSSGSTGEPKGVVLTHKNIDSNVEGAAQVFHVDASDTLLGILPMFHSFGYMTLWFGANRGFATASHANPLDTDAIGELIEKHNVTVIIATPTFLQMYLRRFEPEALGSVRMVLTGAEKLPERLTLAFEERFGIRPMEGYGATECSPIVAISALDVRYAGVFQSGSRRGSVGQPLPGVHVKVVDPDTHESLGPGEPGMLLVRGPNIMKGYLGRDDLTEQAIRDGWYVTGDIALIDEDGFIRITDRLSRFSKIGGEMIPHGKVEEALHEAANATTQTFAVTAVPDEKKGERLAVLHTTAAENIPDLVKSLTDMGLPNLFIPRADQFVAVEELPMLGTGKLDLKSLKKIAMEALG
jgi:acyl-[acyl-carrier-protein]-phospholipid O-acyltransferase/long-chain-fatty-acid--[acyl-carrier-protein] ligase